MNRIHIPGTITNISAKTARTLSIQIVTQELSNEEKAEVMGYLKVKGWICISPNKLQESEIPKVEAPEDGKKSDSERLRNVLWLYHRQIGGKDGDFESWRHRYMEQKIEDIKSVLTQ
jgi:hypothetical protein